jgi:penicillin-binding protein 2
MQKRTVVAFTAIIVLLGGIMLRIYELTGPRLSQAAKQQARLTVTVASLRGTIYDCRLNPLVNHKTEYRVAVTPNPKAIAALSECMDENQLKQVVERLKGGKPVVAKVDTLPAPADGLLMFETPVRFKGKLPAPHVVGYLDGNEVKGAAGAELVFDRILSDYTGKITVTYVADAVGRPLEGIEPVITDTLDNSKGGVVLTIDLRIQKIAEEAAKAYLTRGAVVVMEPKTGHILALVSLPDFQPSNLLENLDSKDSPLINRAFSSYNCGSVFKMVTAIAALEQGIPVSEKFNCSGSRKVGDISFHCHHRLGHGKLDMTEGFAHSCNPYFINLALKTGGAHLYNTSVALGFDRPVFLAEGWKTSRAVIPSRTELLSPAATANLSFGQGALMATPIHISQLVAAIVNNGNMVRPSLLKGRISPGKDMTEEPPAPATAVFSANTAATLRKMMVRTVENGTGTGARPSAGGAGGKTGTAETGWVVNGKPVLQGWFAGFYPADSPEYIITVLAEDTEGTGGKPAPVFKQICEEIRALNTAEEKADVSR